MHLHLHFSEVKKLGKVDEFIKENASQDPHTK